MSNPDGLEHLYRWRPWTSTSDTLNAGYNLREERYTTLVESARLRKLLDLVSLTRKMRKAQQSNLRRGNLESRTDAQECERMVDDALARLD